jgi:hypothetical protein
MATVSTAVHAVADQIGEASATLGRFIEQEAERTAEELGFGYVLTPDAPNSYPALRQAFTHSAATGAPLSISSDNSEAVIYSMPSVNAALRFWHDANHVRRDLSFNLVDELELSLWHLHELESAGYPRASLVWQLLHADLTGQVYLQALSERFPLDQRLFVIGCVTAGFDYGVLDELRRGRAL